MNRVLIALCLLLTSPTFAQPLSSGARFPLTNTHYGTVFGGPSQLVAKDGTFFLFWYGGGIRVTKLVDGERRVGRTVLTEATESFHAVWTGTHFLVVTETPQLSIVGRLLDGNGYEIGPAFPIAENARGPRIASNGRAILLFYTKGETALSSMILTPRGTPVAGSERALAIEPVFNGNDYDVASNGTGFAAAAGTNQGITVWTFDGDGRELTAENLPGVVESGARTLALASNGSDYALVYGDHTTWPRAVLLRPDGSVGVPLTLGRDTSAPDPRNLSLTWTGSAWAAAYNDAQLLPGMMHVTYFDGPVWRELGTEQAPGRYSRSSIAAANGRVLLSWRDATDQTIHLTDLPLTNERSAGCYGAANQVAAGTASSRSATLVVWRELVDRRHTLRVGVRDHDGQWIERELTDEPVVPQSVLAASDGHGFVVIAPRTAWGLDRQGRVLWTKSLTPFRVADVEWTGSEYVVAMFEGDGTLATTTLSTTGVFGATVQVTPSRVIAANLAFDGTGYLVAWAEPEPCPILCPAYGTMHATRLDANRQPVGDVDLGAPFTYGQTQAIWDGRDYVVAWSAQDLEAARIAASGTATPRRFSIAGPEAVDPHFLHVAKVETGLAFAWRESVIVPGNVPVRRRGGALLPQGSVKPERFTRDQGMPFLSEARVEPLPGGFAFIESLPQPDAPHHGSTRVMMTAFAAVLSPRPDAPRLTATADAGQPRIEWTAPNGDVKGYRLEYRIGDGAWNEVEQWFDAGALATILPWSLRQGVPYYFRVRAFNDAGASSYSNVDGLNLARRRAVR